jgi:hypothetical protein
MFKDKFSYAADLVAHYILSRRNMTQSCQSSSYALKEFEFPEDPNTAYAMFRSADTDLWDNETRPGDEGILWVQALEVEASVSQRPRTKKRPRQDAGDGSDENDSLHVAIRRHRQKA